MKRTLSFERRHGPRGGVGGGTWREAALVGAGTCLIAGTYGLVRLAYGLFLPDIQASLDLPSTTAGTISSAASIAYCVGALLGLTSGGQARRLVLGALLTAGAGSAAMALSPDVAVFAPSAVLASMGAGLASPGLVAVVQRNIAPARADPAQAVVNSGTGPGLAAAGVVALVLLPEWRLGFAISAGFTAAAGLVVLLLDRPGNAPAGPPPAPRPAVRRRDSWRWCRVLLAPATAALLLGAGSAAVWTYGRSQLIAGGASETASTVAWVALGLGGTATVLTARSLARRSPPRAWLVTGSTVAVAIGTLAVAAGSLASALAACVLFGWGFVAATSALIAWAAHLVPDRAAPGTAILFVTLVLGQAVGSAAAAATADRFGLSAAFALAAVTALLASACGQRPAGSADRRR